ncbi:MAG: TlpA disulfide reductase family protein [Gammaproteobacteria bacterium]|nr:TlpA disulfide reductase family protein [Gammaproteobacteria bacterium]
MSTDPGDAQTPSVDDHWRIVQAYIDMDTAWHAKTEEIYRAESSDEERERRLKEERGEHPDIMLAVTAARAIVDAGDERALDAARFLVEHPTGLSATEQDDIEFGMSSLKSLVGPDWAVVETLKTRQDDWEMQRDEIYEADYAVDERRALLDELGSPPKDAAATAAALLIVAQGAAHEHAGEAAEFLIKPGVSAPGPETAVMAARSLLEHFPDYDNWPMVLAWMDWSRPWDRGGAVDEFIAEMTGGAADPVVRATARYYAAAALMVNLNRASVLPEEREDMRARALAHAMGLSLGVEGEEFLKSSEDSESTPRTLAQIEASLIHGIRHATVGAILADETGRRLDGSDEKLSAYAGKVLLLDFWATWCGPCVGALPDLRELAAAHPKDHFEILAISVDEEVETVIEFMEDEPMPWAQWHVGNKSELIGSWQIRAYPTYMVIDAQGEILARGLGLAESRSLIEEALGDLPASTAASEA